MVLISWTKWSVTSEFLDSPYCIWPLGRLAGVGHYYIYILVCEIKLSIISLFLLLVFRQYTSLFKMLTFPQMGLYSFSFIGNFFGGQERNTNTMIPSSISSFW